ncbi:MAG: biopolymer transporter ExbD [Pseudomonadota bacterium]
MSIRRRLRSRREPAELNITAFMNLMVVLVPFLLITAVFSRITILELNLPSGDEPAQVEEDKQSLDLAVVVREQSLQVFAANKLVKAFDREGDTYPVAPLNELLVKIKSRSPETLDARVLLEEDVQYDVLVTVMDAMRVAHSDGVSRELFPAISIGDAPPPGDAK